MKRLKQLIASNKAPSPVQPDALHDSTITMYPMPCMLLILVLVVQCWVTMQGSTWPLVCHCVIRDTLCLWKDLAVHGATSLLFTVRRYLPPVCQHPKGTKAISP